MVYNTNITKITTTTNLSSIYNNYIIDATSGSLTATLPTITTDGMNFRLYRDDISNNIVTISTSGGNVINITDTITNTSIAMASLSLIELESFNFAWYLSNFNSQTGTTGPTGPTGTTQFPPTPNTDYYTCRTNQLLTINVVNGVTGNTGGQDTKGGTLTNPTNNITSVTILDYPTNGTLTATGTTGTFTYRSNPRFLGSDNFTYSVTDSTGVICKNTATCYINVVSESPTGTAFIYVALTTNNISSYTNGTSKTIFTASFPGTTGGLISRLDGLATNRDDNLIYYMNGSFSTQTVGKIYAYDYVNKKDFLFLDTNTSPFFGGTGVNFGAVSSINVIGAGGYYNYNLYYPVPNTSTYYIINVAPYNPITVSQQINNAILVTYSDGISRIVIDITFNYNTNKLLAVTSTGELFTIEPFTGTVLFTVTVSGSLTPSGLAFGVNSELIAGNATTIYYINPNNGALKSIGTTSLTVLDCADWISQPV